MITPLVGEGSFMLLDEDEHLQGRRAILPAFHHRFIRDHAAMVQEITTHEIATWPLDTPVSVHYRLRALTLKVILRAIFREDDVRLEELHTRLLAMFDTTASLVLHEPPLRHLPGWRGIWRRFLAERAQVHKIIADLVQQDAHAIARESGILSMLLENDDVKSAEQLQCTLLSMILAGHETTASELAWALQLLAHNQAVVRRVVDDLDGGSEEYLQAVILEVLRHRCVFIFAIPRAVQRPFEVAGITFHAPVHLVGCIHLMHHDPDLYPQPHVFRPERFLGNPPRPDIWMPWGGGRKRCPGLHLAMLEMQIVLRTILSSFDVRPGGRAIEIARWRSVIVTPGRGARIILRRRKGAPGLGSCDARRRSTTVHP